MAKPIMGIQLYTLRNHIQTAEDFDAKLQRLQKMGVTDVQISGIGNIDPVVQKEILERHHMKVCVTHKDFGWMQNDMDDVIRHHEIIGCDAVGIGSAPADSRGSRRAVRDFIAKTEKVADGLAKAGMTFNYHNHAFEFNRLDDSRCSMMEVLLSETDPAKFRFIPDVAWITYADASPKEILTAMKGRVKVLHFKDFIWDENNERKFVSLGKGLVDLRKCYETACELEIPYIMYEQDMDWTENDAFKATEESWDFMQSLIR